MKDIQNMMQLLEILKDPEELKAFITMVVSTLKPILYHVCSECVDMYKDYVNNDEWKALSAENKYKIFQAYVNAGFTEDQAMSLLLTETHEAVMRVQNLSKSSINAVGEGLSD